MDDLISRQAAIMHFVKVSKNYECGMFDLTEVTHELWKVPSSEPERKKGKWIEDGYFGSPCVCSYCGMDGNHYYSFCPYCGADMREEKEDD